MRCRCQLTVCDDQSRSKRIPCQCESAPLFWKTKNSIVRNERPEKYFPCQQFAEPERECWHDVSQTFCVSIFQENRVFRNAFRIFFADIFIGIWPYRLPRSFTDLSHGIRSNCISLRLKYYTITQCIIGIGKIINLSVDVLNCRTHFSHNLN